MDHCGSMCYAALQQQYSLYLQEQQVFACIACCKWQLDLLPFGCTNSIGLGNSCTSAVDHRHGHQRIWLGLHPKRPLIQSWCEGIGVTVDSHCVCIIQWLDDCDIDAPVALCVCIVVGGERPGEGATLASTYRVPSTLHADVAHCDGCVVVHGDGEAM